MHIKNPPTRSGKCAKLSLCWKWNAANFGINLVYWNAFSRLPPRAFYRSYRHCFWQKWSLRFLRLGCVFFFRRMNACPFWPFHFRSIWSFVRGLHKWTVVRVSYPWFVQPSCSPWGTSYCVALLSSNLQDKTVIGDKQFTTLLQQRNKHKWTSR